MAVERDSQYLIAQPANKEVVMVVWCLVLFGLGAAAFLDTQYNYGLIFRQVNAVLFMTMSLAILYRITTKVRLGARETLEAKLGLAQQEIETLRSEITATGRTPAAVSHSTIGSTPAPQEELERA
jgi:hypothetical protein